MSAQQIQTAPPDEADLRTVQELLAELPEADKLSLEEMSRIMDVATTFRKERALVEQQLNIHEIKAKLRERLLEAARVSGDPVTEAEVDAAVEQYYDRLHEFAEPKQGWRTWVAHVWVRRRTIFRLAAAAAIGAAILWSMFWGGLLPGARRDAMIAGERLSAVEKAVAAVDAVALDAAAKEKAAAALATAKAAAESRDFNQIEKVLAEVDALAATLMQDYTLRIVSNEKKPSAVERVFTDETGSRTSGYYVFVEARDARGALVRVPVLNRETGKPVLASRWAEQVPEDVFERLRQDKQADGVLDETLFGTKARGAQDLQIELPGANGQPMPRMGQITSWEN